MFDVKHAYYLCDQDTAAKYWAEWEPTQVAVDQKIANIKQQFDTEMFWKRGNTYLGLVFMLADGESPPTVPGVTFTLEHNPDPAAEKKIMAVAIPDKRTKAGKALHALLRDIEEEERKAPDFNTFILNKNNCVHSAYYEEAGRTRVVRSRAGKAAGHLVIAIPLKDGLTPPVPTADFRPIKLSEFIALTEEQDAQTAA